MAVIKVMEVFPFRLMMDGHGTIVPEFPGECEPQCAESDQLRDQLGYLEYAEYLWRTSQTRDSRQCRGCGRWGLFELRALPAAKPCPCCEPQPGKRGRRSSDCKCREACRSPRCQAGESYGELFVADKSGRWQHLGTLAEPIRLGIRGVPPGPGLGE